MENPEYRIGRALSYLGICPRRNTPEFLKENTVLHKGVRIVDLNYTLDIKENSFLEINGKQVPFNSNLEYYLFHKPPGYVVSRKEQKNQKSVYRLLPETMQTFFYAGRLDVESRGLVLFSNDGDFIYRMTHPSGKTVKKYRVHTSRPLSDREMAAARKGVNFKSERYRFLLLEKLEKNAHYEIHLEEGKNREIRKVMEKFGVDVLDLFRYAMGNYQIGNIPEGKWRKVSME